MPQNFLTGSNNGSTSLGRRKTDSDCVKKDHQRVGALHFLFVVEAEYLNQGGSWGRDERDAYLPPGSRMTQSWAPPPRMGQLLPSPLSHISAMVYGKSFQTVARGGCEYIFFSYKVIIILRQA